jgi:hypothetical protein
MQSETPQAKCSAAGQGSIAPIDSAKGGQHLLVVGPLAHHQVGGTRVVQQAALSQRIVGVVMDLFTESATRCSAVEGHSLIGSGKRSAASFQK